MARQELTVEQIIATIKKHQEVLNALQEELMLRARLQEYTENQFNDLVHVAKSGIELVTSVDRGDTITAEWARRRDELVAQAERLMQDSD